MLELIITPGETKLLEALNKKQVEYKTENLLIGDIHIRSNSNTIYIFERKSKTDLDASIKDGRYHEQKSRLLESQVPRKNIIYIIEALSIPKGSHGRVWGAICNSQHRDGFGIFLTRTIDETVDYLMGMMKSVEKFPNAQADSTADEKIININIKKRQVEPNEWFKYSLTLIPKVSLEIATVIVEAYPKLLLLKKAFDENGAHAISELRHGNSNRRIGKKLSELVYNSILQCL